MSYAVNDLDYWDKKINEIAKEKYGLEWYPIEYEIIDFHEMMGAMAYVGLPTHYRHWSYGKAFERTQTSYNLGQSGLPYEMVINSNPSIAYLMLENPLSTHILTMAHVVGHVHFFTNNRMFKHTGADTIISRFKLAAKRVQSYIENPNIGIDKVEKVLDAAHAIRYQQPRTPGIRRETPEELREKYINLINNDSTGKFEDFDINRKPLESDYNILSFIRENNHNLEEWEKDLLKIAEDEAKYFMPQAQTKIMNEGFACYMHYKLLHDLELPDDMHLAFVKLHNQVVRSHLGKINPYHLGFVMMMKIAEEHGHEAVIEAVNIHDDESFLRKYLDFDLCNELNLFSYSFSKKQRKHVVRDISDEDGWKEVRDALVSTVGLKSAPVVYVSDVDPKSGALHLHHEHDGRDLDIEYANQVFKHIENLWGRRVVMYSIVEGEIWEF